MILDFFDSYHAQVMLQKLSDDPKIWHFWQFSCQKRSKLQILRAKNRVEKSLLIDLYRSELRFFMFFDNFSLFLDIPEKKIFFAFFGNFLGPKNVIFGFFQNDSKFRPRKMRFFTKKRKSRFSAVKNYQKTQKFFSFQECLEIA